MKEIYLNCDSPCFSCPSYNRMIKISNFDQHKLNGSYYCPKCDIYSLCKMGLAYRRHRDGSMQPICTKCGQIVDKIELSYREGQTLRPFNKNSILVIRKPNGGKYSILQTVKGSYFKDLAEVLLYVLYTFGSDKYDIVSYDTLTKNYQIIYAGVIVEENIAIKNDSPTFITDIISFD